MNNERFRHLGDDGFEHLKPSNIRMSVLNNKTITPKYTSKNKQKSDRLLDKKGLIQLGNAKFNLVIHMMLGIRHSVKYA